MRGPNENCFIHLFPVTPMVIGVTVGVSVVVIAVLVTAITFAILQKKKVYPSETDTIFSDSLSDSDFESRPTTASHIFIDPVSKMIIIESIHLFILAKCSEFFYMILLFQ